MSAHVPAARRGVGVWKRCGPRGSSPSCCPCRMAPGWHRFATPRWRRPPRMSWPSSRMTSPSNPAGSRRCRTPGRPLPTTEDASAALSRLRFDGPRPRWLTDALLGVLGVGTGEHSFHGGNVSFRTEALRGVEGFWPAKGRPELHDWFCEEHHAQQQLAAVGWTHACERDMAAVRIIEPERLRRRSVLMLRARYGARSALIGERRPRAVAAKVAASSAAGTAVAAVRGDVATATERAARVAENAGVLVAPLIAHRDLQPAAAQTPFRHSLPPAQPLFAKPRVRQAANGAGRPALPPRGRRRELRDADELRGADRAAGQPLHPGTPGGDRLRRCGVRRVRRHLRRRLRRDDAPHAAHPHASGRPRDDLHLDRPRRLAAQLLVG